MKIIINHDCLRQHKQFTSGLNKEFWKESLKTNSALNGNRTQADLKRLESRLCGTGSQVEVGAKRGRGFPPSLRVALPTLRVG